MADVFWFSVEFGVVREHHAWRAYGTGLLSSPGELEWFADVNPFTTVVDALRHLWLGTPANSDVAAAFGWVVVILAIGVPLAAVTAPKHRLR